MEARIVAEAQRFGSRPDPGLDCGGRLVAGQPARISHDRRDRQVGDRAPVGEAGATEDRPAATALVELEEDPRLADPRLAYDAHDLAVALVGQLEPTLQQGELRVTAHEGRQDPARGELGPRESLETDGA